MCIRDSRYSITQVELRRALDRGVQVFIFIEAQVLAEYRTFVANRDRDIKWVSVDNKKAVSYTHLTLPTSDLV